MSYRKARTQHDEISLRLTCTTYHNSAEKKKETSVCQPHSNTIHQLYNIITENCIFLSLYLIQKVLKQFVVDWLAKGSAVTVLCAVAVCCEVRLIVMLRLVSTCTVKIYEFFLLCLEKKIFRTILNIQSNTIRFVFQSYMFRSRYRPSVIRINSTAITRLVENSHFLLAF